MEIKAGQLWEVMIILNKLWQLIALMIVSFVAGVYLSTTKPLYKQPSYNCSKDIRICELYTQIDKLEREYDERLADCQKRKISINCYDWARK